eukprot:TRINITY_DN14108_c0_g1_i1.p1 TRINITY_DN14108_c0_g1~~TRINITY_DN14108_c0_g1_i1.p1  ORF type:complete len:111 (+),score=40.43 TRINITY_DN14108_c0_g1_i1:28-333(+)
MGKKQLIEALYQGIEKQLSRKSIEQLADTTFAFIRHELKKNGSFSYPKFGTFKVRTSAARTMTNIHTKEKYEVPAKQRVSFTASGSLKDAVQSSTTSEFNN